MMGSHHKILLLFIFFFINSVATQPLSSGTEWRALVDLRASLAIRAKDWPKKVDPCLKWTGITCKNRRVIGINLSGLRRTRGGSLNPSFAVDSLQKLPLLSVFNSSRFALQGSIPQWFGLRLRNLEVLDLRSSSVYGSIPESVGSLSKLSSLYLSKNSITGSIPTALGKLSSLSALDLSQNLLTGQIPSEISSLRNLSSIDLSLNYLSGDIPPGLGSLSNLKLLNLSYNVLSDPIPSQLGNLSQLIQLDIGFNKLNGSLLSGFFEKLYHLEYLDLHGNYFRGEIPSALESMSRLKYLDVSGNNFTGGFPNLTSFNVSDSVFNFSNNLLYGNLTSGIGRVHIIDVSNNYFRGSAPNNTGIRFILSNNCFMSVPDQRDFETCEMFYLGRGMFFGNDSDLEPKFITQHKSRRRLAYVMIGVFGGLGFIIVLISGTLVLLKVCSRRFNNHRKDGEDGASAVEGGVEIAPKVVVEFSGLGQALTYEQILLATNNFSSENLIKKGHSGDLFCGMLESGQDVVIKRIDLDSLRSGSFKLELDFFGKVSHPRLVPVMGHCLEDEEKFLVYKNMLNGDLSNALFRLTNSGRDLQTLDWITRLKIAIGAAEALSYLHHECSPAVIHRDIQASSILLDDKYEVRLGSFSEVCASASSNNQNVFARLLHTPQTSEKRPTGSSSSITHAYDVYCFGKVLLELVTGKLGISRSDSDEVKQWLESYLCLISIQDKEEVIKIIDQSLIIDEDLLEEVWAVAVVAKSCLNPKASRRPSMRHVLKALENPFKVVRKEYYSSENLRPTSSRLSLAAAFYGSRHHSSSGSSNRSAQMSREIIGGLRQTERVGSRSSGTNDHSSSLKRSSSDVFPEPLGTHDGNGTS